jgi:hypothetical protein
MTHSGAEWIKENYKVKLSPLGVAVADLLGDLFGGIYHLETKYLKEVDWGNDHHIVVTLRHKSLATFDYDELTRLVFLCHDHAIRCSVDARANNMLELMFHQREREGGISKRHPTIEQALEMWRKYHQFGQEPELVKVE